MALALEIDRIVAVGGRWLAIPLAARGVRELRVVCRRLPDEAIEMAIGL
jgi:hypothetical protein